MTVPLQAGHESKKPLSWRAAVAFSGSTPYSDTPVKGDVESVTGCCSHDQGWGIYATLGMGNMLALDRNTVSFNAVEVKISFMMMILFPVA